MKIATYNVWNDESKGRFEQLIYEINHSGADVIALQEVTPDFFHILKEKSDYAYQLYEQYPKEEEGLAVLSRHPFLSHEALFKSTAYDNSAALHVLFEANGMKFSFTNVHLPWDSIKKQENQAIEIDRYLHSQLEEADFFILLGDFNSDLDSSVDRYLRGAQTLYGEESTPHWNELARAASAFSGENVKPTLDVIHNPRWAGQKTIYTPSVMDRIYIMDYWCEDCTKDVALEDFRLFGTEVSPKTHLAASDHYGVLADIVFTKTE